MKTGVLLAAGKSSRYGSPKQLIEIQGEPLVRRIAREALASSLEELVVVTGHAQKAVRQALDSLVIVEVHNPRFADGQASSVAVGISVLGRATSHALFLVCDQPGLDRHLIDLVLLASRKRPDSIIVPRSNNRPGGPVCFPRRFFEELQHLQGDEGGRQLIRRHPCSVHYIEPASPQQLRDVDTPKDWLDFQTSRSAREP